MYAAFEVVGFETKAAAADISCAINLQPVTLGARFTKRSDSATVAEESNPHIPINLGITPTPAFGCSQSSTEVPELSSDRPKIRWVYCPRLYPQAIVIAESDLFLAGRTDFKFDTVGFASPQRILQEAIQFFPRRDEPNLEVRSGGFWIN